MAIRSALDYIPEDEFLKLFVTGDFGTGKSVLAASFPTPGFVFCFDSKIKPYAGQDFTCATYEISQKGWLEFERDVPKVAKAVAEGKFKSVIIDSTTSMMAVAMAQALALDPKRSSTDGPLWNVHYQMVRNLLDGRLKQIINMPANICVIAHLEIKVDQETGAVIGIQPLLTGQLANLVPGYFEEVYCSFTGQKEGKTIWYVRTVPWGHYKSRSELRGKAGLLPDILPNDYSAIMDAYRKGVQRKKEKEAATKE